MLRALLLTAVLDLHRCCSDVLRSSARDPSVLGLRRGTALLLLPILLGGAGCGNRALHVRMTIAPDANGNAPVILSVVFVKNPALQQKVMELSAKQWFGKREQLLRDNRREITESYYEFVPGQQVPQLDYKIGGGTSQGILFVNYGGPSPHRYVFDTARPVQVSFGSRSVTLSP